MKREILSLRKALPCLSCGEVMHSVFNYCIRHTCHECGGVSLAENIQTSRTRILEEYRKQHAALKAERLLAKEARFVSAPSQPPL